MIGKCPFCDDGVVEMTKKEVRGATTKVYACTNVAIRTEDGECFEHTGSCTFRIWGNALQRYGKRAISVKEARELLGSGSLIVTLRSRVGGEYRRYAIPHREHGIEVLFGEEVPQA